MELIMLRHFQTPGNLKKQYIGRTDEPLAKNQGLEKLICQRQKDCLGTEAVILSPMQRCVQTAELIFPRAERMLCEKMRECDFGLFEGKSYEELKENQEYRLWLESNGTLPFPGGEDPVSFRKRCAEGFTERVNELFTRRIDKAAMVVHGGTIMAVLSAIDVRKRGFYDFQPENGGGYRLRLDEADWKRDRKISREIEKL